MRGILTLLAVARTAGIRSYYGKYECFFEGVKL